MGFPSDSEQIRVRRSVINAGETPTNFVRSMGGTDLEGEPEDEFTRKGVWLGVKMPPVGYEIPKSYRAALADAYWPCWKLALDAEWGVLKDKGTMKVVKASVMPPGQNPSSSPLSLM